MNVVAISGNLTEDPELKMAGETPVCRFTVAVHERKKQGDEWIDVPNFFYVDVFRAAEWLSTNLKKGGRVALTGRLKQRKWEKDGIQRETISIIADEVVPMAGVGAKQDAQPAQQPQQQQPSQPSQDGKRIAIANTQSEYTYGSPIGETANGTPVYHDVEIPF